MLNGIVVRVRYLGWTDFKPSRLSAQIMSGSMSESNSKPLVQSRDLDQKPHEQAVTIAQQALKDYFGDQWDGRDATAMGATSTNEWVVIF